MAAALPSLGEPLSPHLRGEEDDAMTLASPTLTDAEWRTWDQQHNVRGKSLSRLAAEGHWLMDGLDPDPRDILLHLVPAAARIIIVKGYARRYRAACARRWRPAVNVAPSRCQPDVRSVIVAPSTLNNGSPMVLARGMRPHGVGRTGDRLGAKDLGGTIRRPGKQGRWPRVSCGLTLAGPPAARRAQRFGV